MEDDRFSEAMAEFGLNPLVKYAKFDAETPREQELRGEGRNHD